MLVSLMDVEFWFRCLTTYVEKKHLLMTPSKYSICWKLDLDEYCGVMFLAFSSLRSSAAVNPVHLTVGLRLQCVMFCCNFNPWSLYGVLNRLEKCLVPAAPGSLLFMHCGTTLFLYGFVLMTSELTDRPLYDVNEKVLCSCEDGLYYEAKIVRVGRAEDGGLHYKVHYQGWSKTYDEIIHQNMVTSRFIRLTPQTLKEALNAQNVRREMDRVDKERKGRRRSKKSLPTVIRKDFDDGKSNEGSSGLTRKRSITSSSCSEELNVSSAPSKPKAFKFGVASGSGIGPMEAGTNQYSAEFLDDSCPSSWADDSLMVILEKDRQLVESGLKVSLLPAKYTANKIANEFAKYVRQVNKANRHNFSGEKGARWKLFMKAFDECIQAFQDFFDIVIESRILSDTERTRHEELVSSGIVTSFEISDIFEEAKGGLRPSQYYGFIHVVRLLVGFEKILVCWTAPGVTVQVFEFFVKKFLKWLAENVDKYFSFTTDYQEVSKENYALVEYALLSMEYTEFALGLLANSKEL
ncbi:unnamed protein product [Enterobius vermicularis]|uniref:MRG domain-containing protein n=1 Tax=Enterobius vermicularis TaxID=51028 RepID=A0A0N4UX94_ENTVE|nr:unnamed protein product [Enterobius vermicularis]